MYAQTKLKYFKKLNLNLEEDFLNFFEEIAERNTYSTQYTRTSIVFKFPSEKIVSAS